MKIKQTGTQPMRLSGHPILVQTKEITPGVKTNVLKVNPKRL